MPKAEIEDEGVYMTTSETADTGMRAKDGKSNVLSLPVSVVVSIGGVRFTMRDLLDLKADSVLKLDSTIEDPVQLMIGDKIIATGELVEKDGAEMTVRIVALAGEQNAVR